MKAICWVFFFLLVHPALAQHDSTLYNYVIDVMERDLHYVYDSTSDRPREVSASMSINGNDSAGIRDHFKIIDNPSPLIILNGVRTKPYQLKRYEANQLATVEVRQPDDPLAVSIYGTRGSENGLILITTKANRKNTP